ncbi:MAG: precorrin-6y C5,15-methyltransferase (decarboxylating) subunit CbiE [Gammaproteobacteria bacterium]|nr:precorrin-6y C5,15-methyltransferase (decarboxylating) subunit CbiE [Gammaproteobacteria bacterium]
MEITGLTGIYAKPLKSAPIRWQGHPVTVISLGCSERSVLPDAAMDGIRKADLVLGARHHLKEIAHIETDAEQRLFPSPFSALREILESNQGRRIIVLASGDALLYGIGTWLNRLVGREHLVFHPNLSSIQYCFHAIGLPWQQAEIVSVHGRPLKTLRRHIRHNHLIAVITDDQSSPDRIAGELCRQGYGESRMWVCEAMGRAEQQIQQYTAAALSRSGRSFHPLNVCIILQKRNREMTQPPLPVFPGIADHLFATGSKPGYGMISKRETRLAILSLMQPESGEIAWDIGAGCGSVSVEWARWNDRGQIYAIEQSPTRMDRIRDNSERFGTTLNLTPVQGTAPDCCDALPDPDAVFVGGSGGLAAMLAYAWDRLKPGGKLVASAVTDPSQAALAAFYQDKPAREWITLAVEKNLPDRLETRSLAPVTIAKCVRSAEPAGASPP